MEVQVKEMMKRIAALLSALLILSGCSNAAVQNAQDSHTADGSESTPEHLTLYPHAVEMPAGRTLKLKTSTVPADAAVQWETADAALLDISEDGTLTAKAAGETTVTAKAGDKAASCAVRVTAEGLTLLWSGSLPPEEPPLPPDRPDDSPETESEEPEIPVEVPDDVITVETIPELDEYLWKIKIDTQYPTTVTNDGITLDADVHIKFIVEKKGGKTPLGTYHGIFYGDADLNREKLLAFMNAQLAGAGEVIDYQEHDTAEESPITVEVVKMDNAAYHAVIVPHPDPNSITQQLPVAHLPGSLMALGELTSPITVGGSYTYQVGGITATAPFGGTNAESQPYALDIYGRYATVRFPAAEQNGLAQCSADGTFSRSPIFP